jgi:hypothetical protein
MPTTPNPWSFLHGIEKGEGGNLTRIEKMSRQDACITIGSKLGCWYVPRVLILTPIIRYNKEIEY